MADPIKIFLLEDNQADADMLIEAFEEADIIAEIMTYKTGKTAWEFIESCDDECDNIPDVFVIDINVPVVSGHEVIESIKESEKFLGVPVCIFTSSETNFDIMRGYQNSVIHYFVKPSDPEKYIVIANDIKNLVDNFRSINHGVSLG